MEKQFHKNPLHFRINADFEADNEIDGSKIGNKINNVYKQNPVHTGYYIISELEDVLESGYYESPLGYNNVDWYVNQVIKLENKMAFFFENTKKISFRNKKMRNILIILIFVDFVKKKYYLIKFMIIAT